MKIKRFQARTMREALRQVREEQGPDSVILSKHKVADGIEVIAAVDYDEALLQQSVNRSVRTASPAAVEPAGVAGFEAARREVARAAERDRSPDPSPASAGAAEAPELSFQPASSAAADSLEREGHVQGAHDATVVVPEPAVPSAGATTVEEIHEQLRALRETLEAQHAELRWDDLQRREPRLAEVIRRFSLMELSRPVMESIVCGMNATGELREIWRHAIGVLARRLPLATGDVCDEGGIFALVGPTGAGKTTCVAKLAARFALAHGADQIGLVSTDADRIGAREQLLRFGKILGAPVQIATDGDALCTLLDQLADKSLVLIDTAGFAPRNNEAFARLRRLLGSSPTIQTLLTLPANLHSESLRETLSAFDRLGLDGAITTKLDEATSLGGLLSILIDADLLVSYVADGQDIPEDIRCAERYRAGFVSRAVTLAGRAAARQTFRRGEGAATEHIDNEETNPLTDRSKQRLRVAASG